MHFWRKMDGGCWQLKTCNGSCADHGHAGLVGKAVQWTSLGWSVRFSYLHLPPLKRGSAKSCWERDQATNTSGIRIVPEQKHPAIQLISEWVVTILRPWVIFCAVSVCTRTSGINIYMCARMIHVLLSSEHVCSITNSLKLIIDTKKSDVVMLYFEVPSQLSNPAWSCIGTVIETPPTPAQHAATTAQWRSLLL